MPLLCLYPSSFGVCVVEGDQGVCAFLERGSSQKKILIPRNLARRRETSNRDPLFMKEEKPLQGIHIDAFVTSVSSGF